MGYDLVVLPIEVDDEKKTIGFNDNCMNMDSKRMYFSYNWYRLASEYWSVSADIEKYVWADLVLLRLERAVQRLKEAKITPGEPDRANPNWGWGAKPDNKLMDSESDYLPIFMHHLLYLRDIITNVLKVSPQAIVCADSPPSVGSFVSRFGSLSTPTTATTATTATATTATTAATTTPTKGSEAETKKSTANAKEMDQTQVCTSDTEIVVVKGVTWYKIIPWVKSAVKQPLAGFIIDNLRYYTCMTDDSGGPAVIRDYEGAIRQYLSLLKKKDSRADQWLKLASYAYDTDPLIADQFKVELKDVRFPVLLRVED